MVHRILRLALLSALLGAASVSAGETTGEAPHRNVILVLGAVPQEIPPIVAALEHATTTEIRGVPVWRGTLHGKPLAVAITGIGKTFTALTATLLITELEPRVVVMTGTGARIDPALRTGDVIVASHLYEHDYGSLTREGMVYRPMNGPRNGAEVANEFQPPPALLDLARQAMADYPPRTVTVDGASSPNDDYLRLGPIAAREAAAFTAHLIRYL